MIIFLKQILAIIGPTLLDLQIAVGVSVDEIAAIIPSKAAGYVFGSIIGNKSFFELLFF